MINLLNERDTPLSLPFSNLWTTKKLEIQPKEVLLMTSSISKIIQKTL